MNPVASREGQTRAVQGPLLVLHDGSEVVDALRAILAPREVRAAVDEASALAEARRAVFDAAIIQHPLRGVAAPRVARWLRDCGATCPLLVIAEAMPAAEARALQEELGQGATVLTSGETFGILVAIKRLLGSTATHAPATGATAPDSALVAESTEVTAFVERLGAVPIALGTDASAVARWSKLHPSPVLVRLLDGTRSLDEVVVAAGLPPGETLSLLWSLDREGCLVLGAAAPPAAPSPEPSWTPKAPRAAADDQWDLADQPLPEVILRLRRAQETGNLFVHVPEWIVQLDLARGMLVRGCGGPRETWLGPTLLRIGHVDGATLERVVAEYRRALQSNPGVHLGDVGLRMGSFSAMQLQEALAAQADAKLRAVLSLHQGAVRFYRDASALRWAGLSPRPIETIIASALRENESWRQTLIGRFHQIARDKSLRAAGAMDLLPLFGFGPRVQRLLGRIEGRRLVDIVGDSTMPPPETEMVLYLLWAAGGIELDVPREAPRSSAPPPMHPATPGPPAAPAAPLRAPSTAAPGSPEARQEAGARLDLAEEALGRREFEAALRLLEEARRLDPGNAIVLAAMGWAVFRQQPGADAARERAKGLLAEALEIDADLIEAHVSLGKICRVGGDYTEARAHFERARALDPANQRVLEELEALDSRFGGQHAGGAGSRGKAEDDSSRRFLSFLFRKRRS